MYCALCLLCLNMCTTALSLLIMNVCCLCGAQREVMQLRRATDNTANSNSSFPTPYPSSPPTHTHTPQNNSLILLYELSIWIVSFTLCHDFLQLYPSPFSKSILEDVNKNKILMVQWLYSVVISQLYYRCCFIVSFFILSVIVLLSQFNLLIFFACHLLRSITSKKLEEIWWLL
jgi:hypothetical protein